MFRGHTGGSVNDTAFDPFDDDRLVSGGEDGKICIWEIPKDYTYAHCDGENIQDVAPLSVLSGHTRKIGHLSFNPVAKNILASSSFDYSIKIWDLDTMECITTLQQKDLITSFSWNYNGTQIATASRDKKLRIYDARSGILLQEGAGHTGAKSTRVVWLGNTDRIATTGFDRFSERQIGLWNTTDLSAGAIGGGVIPVDSSSGILMPFFDPSTNLLMIAGKGDGNVRYYEYSQEDDDIYELSEYQSTDAQRGFAITPKRCVNVKENEILKAFKLLNNGTIQPLSFIVPRRAEMFQEDIFPDAPAEEPAMTAAEFRSGKVVLGPMLLSMKDIYDGVSTPSVTQSNTAPSSAKKAETPAATPAPVKTEVKAEPVVEAKPALTQTAERGVETMLKETKVDSLLSKVNDLSDDEYQGKEQDNETNDDDEEWKVEKKEPVKKAESPVSEPAPSAAVEKKTVESAKLVESAKPVETKPVEKASPVTSTTEASSASSAPSSGGLKANLEKLHTLVSTLETTVEKLTKANLEKDEKLKSLEEKLDLILKKL